MKKVFKHNPALCHALNGYFADSKAWGRAHIAYIRHTILQVSK